jgi:hypothetical protein
MHFSSNTKPPSQSYLPSLASRTGIWSPASGTLLPPPSLDNEKSSPQISSQLEQSFRLSPLIFLPGSRSRGSGNQPRKPSTVAECRCPHNPTAIAPGRQDWLYLNPSNPNDKAQARIPCPGPQSAKLLMLLLRLCSRAEDAKRSVSGRLGTPVLYVRIPKRVVLPFTSTNNKSRLQKERSIEGESNM